jgi:NRAMP (natural resistance-associated macrophage protein)-like metal ion transporter
MFTRSSIKKIEENIVETAEGYWEKLGPGLTTGAADDDPSGIATYSQTGAKYGLGFVWLALFTYPLIGIVQEMCARIGLVTGKGLAGIIKTYYPRWILYSLTLLLFAANAFNIGADLGAMAQATRLLTPALPAWLLVILFTFLSLYLQIFTSYKTYAKYLKWLALVLFSYIFTAFTLKLDWGDIIYHTLIPQFPLNRDSILLLGAVLGTTISPYLFFWQTSQEIEAKNMHTDSSPRPAKIVVEIDTKEMKDMRVDVWSGMFISNIVMFFIMVVCAVTLFPHGITNINSAADAAAALLPLAGKGAYLLFAVGIIGSGLLAIPILAASTSYAISESMQWGYGLNKKFREAHAFYGVIILSMIVGLLLNFIGLDPIKALIYSAFANCLVAPPALIFVILVSKNKKIMGKHTNSNVTTLLGWVITAIMIAASIGTLVAFWL